MEKLEFSLLDNKDENLIKIKIEQWKNELFFELITKRNSLGLEPSIIVGLTAEDLLKIITDKYNEEVS